MTSGSKIDYEALAQAAMRGVVRAVLVEVARSGLPGDHHFYVSFDTQAPGVSISKRLREKYPDEMTIVLQHRFWDLVVLEDRFEVKLTFDGIPERLVIPFAALRVFFDPSVRYGLQFEDPNYAPEAGAEASDAARAIVVSATNNDTSSGGGARVTRPGERRPRQPKKPKAEKPAGETASPSPAPAQPFATIGKPTPATVAPVASSATGGTETSTTDADAAKKPDGAQIVSLDAFRKK